MENILIEVAYGDNKKQKIYRLTLPSGSTARQAVLNSPLSADFPEADLYAPLGIFGKSVPDTTPLQTGDRVELYRPLKADPKEARRLKAAQKRNLLQSNKKAA